MPSPTVPLREFADSFAAESLRGRLAAADIRAFVTGTDYATALGLGGAATTRGVRVEVAPTDYDRAVEILDHDDRIRNEATDWVCGRCDEPNDATFEICWSCSKPRSPDDVTYLPKFEGPDQVDAPEPFSDSVELDPSQRSIAVAPEDGNPYRPVIVSDQPDDVATRSKPVRRAGLHEDQLDERVRHVLRASMAGCLLLPPVINLVVMGMLLRLPADASANAWRRRRIAWAWIINLVAVPVGIAGWLVMWPGFI